MKFDTPATKNPTDRKKVIGKSTDRYEGKAKTTGTAKYAYEWHDIAPKPAYGYVLGAGIAKGRIASMDTSAAESAPGVFAVVTAENAGPLGKGNFNKVKLLAGPEVQHYHQAVAVVVARSFEEARAAAGKIKVRYTAAPGAYDLAKAKDAAITPPPGWGGPSDTAVGDFAGAFASAPFKVDATYTTPDHTHAMMEPFASIAAWKGDQLTVWTSNQMIAWSVADMAKTLNMSPEKVRLVSPYIGGGFGGKLWIRADAVLAALGSRATKRPVKVSLQRPLMANNTVHRPATIQRVRLGATQDGKITAFAHETWSGDVPGGGPEMGVLASRALYAGANRLTATRLATLDLPEGNAMRAPGDAPGSMAFEVAVDELSVALRMDPVQLRILNDTQVNPEKPAQTYSTRKLVECLRLGADKFGWSNRKPQPGKVREGRWLIGQGVATAYRGAPTLNSAARVRLDARGIVTVETDMTDIGTGSYTVLAQTAAEMMGVSFDKVVVHLGDSKFPVSCGSGGQFGAVSATSGVYAACVKLREAIAKKLGVDPATADFTDGVVVAGSRRVPLGEAAGEAGLVAEDKIEFASDPEKHLHYTFGAHFVEVAVDSLTAEVRVRRMLAVCSAGRILNPKAARNQIIGAMTMGVGAALMEDLVVDKRLGFFVNHDLASYEVPVHADIPHQECIFLDDEDPTLSPMKAMGVGELGICGVSAAVANAIYNATGVRVREYPITLDKLIKEIRA
ncbi:MAG: xanthine dehydrogenase family protein molybdopterin-binding subunit [Steroidobacteraceae bacterium]|nr:xanthine dehydrogenase family protein molybdopterin-binding subunit [Steroidobacteraceae bacterium]